MLAFRVDGRRYALPLGAVLAVTPCGEGEAVAFRGRQVPVTDAGDLGMGSGGEAARTRTALIVLGGERGPLAVRVDGVDGIVEGAETRPWPALVAALVGPGFPGLVLGREEALLMVDADALTSEGETRGSGRPGEAREKP